MEKKRKIKKILYSLMRSTIHQLFLAAIFVSISYSNDLSAQKLLHRSVTLSAKQVKLEWLLEQITEQTDISFVYSHELIHAERRVTVQVTNGSLKEVLKSVLRPMDIAYSIGKRQTILLRKKDDQPGSLQKTGEIPSVRLLSGKVTDENGEALPGVNIIVKGTSRGVISDSKGAFTIEIPDENAVLVFSFVGYVSVELVARNETMVTVSLQVDQKALDEVVVVGYGVQKRVNVTGSVASVNGEELQRTPAVNLSNSVGGRLPGLIAINNNGRPGSGSTIRIRGYSTLNDNSPLYVVDGVVRSDGFENIDPNEVESIAVLKDASAAAVYGARAANGVILVTTKRGKTGKPTISYNAFFGIQNPTQYPELMTAYQHLTTRNTALRNQGYSEDNPLHAGMFYSDSEIEKAKRQGYDWYDASFKKNSGQSQHNLSITGGTEAIRYFSSLGYFNQNGMYDNINSKRFNLRSNVDATVNKNLTIGLNLEARQKTDNDPGYAASQIFLSAIGQNPAYPAFYPSGRAFNTTGSHPVMMSRASGYGKYYQNIFQGTLNFEHKLPFLSGLSLRGAASYFKQMLSHKRFLTPYTMYDEDESGNVTGTKVDGGQTSLSQNSQDVSNIQLNMALNYARKFGVHDFSGLVLFEQFSSEGSTFTATKQDFKTNAKDEFFASGPVNQTITGNGLLYDARRSLVGRINYSLYDKYLFEGTFRYDGSYRFPKNSRFGFFPAFSAAWRISEERFFQNNRISSLISNLKLRASHGVIGNDRVNAFQFMNAYTINAGNGPVVNGQPLANVDYGVFPNTAITWEKQYSTNIGLELGMLSNRIGLELDYFTRNTKDILWSRDRSVPATFGRSLPNENYASVYSEGFELSLSHQNRIKSGLEYNVRLIGSFAKNVVTNIDDPANALDFQRRLGRSVDFLIGYKSSGLFQNTTDANEWYGGSQFGQKSIAGDIRYEDIDGDGKITISDQTILSDYSAVPRINFGLSGSVSYRNFDMSFLFQGAAQRTVMLSTDARSMFRNGGSRNTFGYLLDSWSPENTDAKYPIAWVDSRMINDRDAGLWLRQADYLRLKQVDLGYTFPLSSLGIQKMRMYLSGFNLFTLSRMKEFDPEAEVGTGSYYPQQKNINIGVNLTF